MSERIVYRDSKCTCGCNGRDPWHQREYMRIVRNRRVLSEHVVFQSINCGRLSAYEVAEVKLPRGLTTVIKPVITIGERAIKLNEWVTVYDH